MHTLVEKETSAQLILLPTTLEKSKKDQFYIYIYIYDIYINIYICMKLLKTVDFFIVLMKIKLFKMNTEALNKNIGIVHRQNVLATCRLS